MDTYEIKIAEDTKYEIRLMAVRCGRDLSVTVCGGTLHHVGAVALACGCMPDGSALKYSATISTIVVLDHKDDAVAKILAGRLADEIHGNVTVTAGIHIDHARQEELEILQKNCMKACELLTEKLA